MWWMWSLRGNEDVVCYEVVSVPLQSMASHFTHTTVRTCPLCVNKFVRVCACVRVCVCVCVPTPTSFWRAHGETFATDLVLYTP